MCTCSGSVSAMITTLRCCRRCRARSGSKKLRQHAGGTFATTTCPVNATLRTRGKTAGEARRATAAAPTRTSPQRAATRPCREDRRSTQRTAARAPAPPVAPRPQGARRALRGPRSRRSCTDVSGRVAGALQAYELCSVSANARWNPATAALRRPAPELLSGASALAGTLKPRTASGGDGVAAHACAARVSALKTRPCARARVRTRRLAQTLVGIERRWNDAADARELPAAQRAVHARDRVGDAAVARNDKRALAPANRVAVAGVHNCAHARAVTLAHTRRRRTYAGDPRRGRRRRAARRTTRR